MFTIDWCQSVTSQAAKFETSHLPFGREYFALLDTFCCVFVCCVEGSGCHGNTLIPGPTRRDNWSHPASCISHTIHWCHVFFHRVHMGSRYLSGSIIHTHVFCRHKATVASIMIIASCATFERSASLPRRTTDYLIQRLVRNIY